MRVVVKCVLAEGFLNCPYTCVWRQGVDYRAACVGRDSRNSPLYFRKSWKEEVWNYIFLTRNIKLKVAECLEKVISEENVTSTKVNLVPDFRKVRRWEVSMVQSCDTEHPWFLWMDLVLVYKQLQGAMGLTSTYCNDGNISVSKTCIWTISWKH